MDEIILDVECFNLKYTLECGQCFRWKLLPNEDNTYIGVISDRVIKIRQEKDKLYIKSNKIDNLESVVYNYFDLYKNYNDIENKISKIDKNIKKAVNNSSGIRILNQDFFETVISYIISANNNIPRISRSINEISKRYGKKIIFENNEYYLFPTPNQLANATEEDFRRCGVGFRAKYIKDTVEQFLNDNISYKELSNKSTEELRNTLLKFKGIGPKVADCILLFSCTRGEVFPIDVWVERIMTSLYFKEQKDNIKKKDIIQYADNEFKEYSGIIQQHLFYNVREGLI